MIECARKYGVSSPRIAAILAKAGISYKTVRKTKQEENMILNDMLIKQLTVQDCARLYGVTHGYISKILKQHNDKMRK